MIGDELYAWQVLERTGEWSTVGAFVAELGTHSPLVHRRLDIVRRLEPYARSHARSTGQPLRLAKFVLEQVLEIDGL